VAQKERVLDATSNVKVVESDRIEPIAGDPDFQKLIREKAEADAFANELVTTRLYRSGDKNTPNHAILSVNGVTQVVIADGKPRKIRRKFVEVLARCWQSTYEQRQHPIELDRYEMLEDASLAYPFEVTDDPNPRGKAWLEGILQEKN
jgi:hypothetical protein